MKAIKSAAFAALLGSAAVFAQSPTPAQTEPTQPMDRATTPTPSTQSTPDFTTLDRNSDGKISKDEAKQDSSLNSQFSTLDADKNGSLSISEYAGYKSSSTNSSSPKSTTTPNSSGY